MNEPVRRLRFDLAYDGTEFAGWQRQREVRTVQAVLEDALSRLQGGIPAVLRAAGRTDAGAHARGQVADCTLSTRLDDARLAHSLRCLLPDDLRVISARTVADEFDSQRDALAKSYRYRLDLTLHGDPFRSRYALHQPKPLDRAALADALGRLPGRRDWSGFTSSKCVLDDRVRGLTRAEFGLDDEHDAWLEFSADGFLTHMVRNLVGTLLEIARGRMEPRRIDEIVEGRDRRRAGPTAPAHGLTLWRVRYVAGVS